MQRLAFLEDAEARMLVNDETRDQMITQAHDVALRFRAILPDPQAQAYALRVALIVNIGRRLRRLLPEPDISDVMEAVADVLDASIAAESYVIREEDADYQAQRIDLTRLDPDRLRAIFAQGRQRVEATKLRNATGARIKRMVTLNRARTSYLERFQQLIEEYNSGSLNVEMFYEQLIALIQALDAEEQRVITERLSEEELALFDLITQSAGDLSDAERERVKQGARELLAALKHEWLVLDWRKKQQAKAAVQMAVADAVASSLPNLVEPDVQRISETVYQHIYDAYRGDGHSIYA